MGKKKFCIPVEGASPVLIKYDSFVVIEATSQEDALNIARKMSREELSTKLIKSPTMYRFDISPEALEKLVFDGLENRGRGRARILEDKEVCELIGERQAA